MTSRNMRCLEGENEIFYFMSGAAVNVSNYDYKLNVI